jgi:hypothetical protein
MVITGSFASFKAWVNDDPKREADTLLFQMSPTGRVITTAFPRETIEWKFPATEVVTFDMLRTVIRKFIQVDDWTF